MMLFKDGQMASMKVGAMPKQKILEWLESATRRPLEPVAQGRCGASTAPAR